MKTRKKPEREQRKAVPKQLLLAIAITLLTLFAVQASASIEITLLQQTSPVEWMNNQTILVGISANTTITSVTIEINNQSKTMQKQENTNNYDHSWKPQNKGMNQYAIRARTTENETAEYLGGFEVTDTTQPQITGSGPGGKINNPTIELYATTDENATCRYDTSDISYASMRYLLQGISKTHTEIKSLPDSSYQYYVACQDQSQNIGGTTEISFTIDTQKPQITQINPAGTQAQSQQDLKITTNEPATCKWGVANQEYDQLPSTFQQTQSTHHQQPITLNEGTNTYYLACQDYAGNKNPSQAHVLTLNTPPKASINIKKTESYPKLKTGTYDLELTTSEPVKNTPMLSLQCGLTTMQVPLEGSSQKWEGNLIIPEGTFNCPGEFKYSGIDLQNLGGAEITSGKLALIDTRKPPSPLNLKAINQENHIKISWTQQGDETDQLDHYKIYRSITGNTDQNDLKYTTSSTTHNDLDVQDHTGYFYKVSAISKSGIESDLSKEAFIMALYENITAVKQDPVIKALIDNKITGLEKKIQELSERIIYFSEKPEAQAQEVINRKKILPQIQDAQNKMRLLIGGLKTYLDSDLDYENIIQKVRIIDVKTGEYEKSIPSDLIIKDISSQEQGDVTVQSLEAAEEYLKTRPLTDAQKKLYYETITALQGQARITRKITSYELFYEDGRATKETLIQERVLLPESLKTGVLVQELIPKGSLRLTETVFDMEPLDINMMGPSWSIKALPDAGIGYYHQTPEDILILRTIKTVLLLNSDEFLDQIARENTVSDEIPTTGNVVKQTTSNKTLTYLGLMLGVVALALITYYYRQSKTALAANESLDEPLRVEEKQSLSEHRGYDFCASQIARAYNALEKGDAGSARFHYSIALDAYRGGGMGVLVLWRLKLELNLLYGELERADSEGEARSEVENRNI